MWRQHGLRYSRNVYVVFREHCSDCNMALYLRIWTLGARSPGFISQLWLARCGSYIICHLYIHSKGNNTYIISLLWGLEGYHIKHLEYVMTHSKCYRNKEFVHSFLNRSFFLEHLYVKTPPELHIFISRCLVIYLEGCGSFTINMFKKKLNIFHSNYFYYWQCYHPSLSVKRFR